MGKLCTSEVGGVKMKKKEKKKHFVVWKNQNIYMYIFGYSFGFTFQRWFVKLEKAFL
jgi:hypothetical protein